MKAEATVRSFKIVYKYVLRPVLYKLTNDNNYKWDDKLLEMCDYIFGYTKEA